MVTPIETTQETFRSRFKGERKDGGLARARSLRSDRGWLELGRYVATELGLSSVATWRPSRVRARSLRSDLAWLKLYESLA
ncbi:hypothetical protein F2Q68_00040179 [Brassica cretica]|uniref:Uncharacterized protein n=2 Tax=Brassica cretica TaxID=69181 RepID=A0A8S9MT15_BRACR|nr:hypothetical protein F2Q68_00040179 [Brassica cretica]KAF3498355.1 hypothetical protein DY000_02053885 [Brassica cretica]